MTTSTIKQIIIFLFGMVTGVIITVALTMAVMKKTPDRTDALLNHSEITQETLDTLNN